MLYNKDINSWDEWIALREQGYTEVTRDFYCAHNKLTSLEGAPRSVGGKFYCSNNPLKDDKHMTFYNLKFELVL